MGTTLLKFIGGLGALGVAMSMALEWTGSMDRVRENVIPFRAWGVTVNTTLQVPFLPSTLVIFIMAAEGGSLVAYLKNRKGRVPRYAGNPVFSENLTGRLDLKGLQACGVHYPTIRNQRCKEEWEHLEERDREVIREIVLKGGLMEADISALRHARGLEEPGRIPVPLTERVSFIHVDYTGYHSIVPAFLLWLNQKIQEEMRDESIAQEIR